MENKDPKFKLNNSAYFINRELSWLEFNQQVLREAKDRQNPLLERIKFLAIAYSNLDEFFMVKVAAIKDQANEGIINPEPSGLLPKQLLKQISIRTQKMVRDIYNSLSMAVLPGLNKNGVKIYQKADLSQGQKRFLEEYFINAIYPVLTPMAVDFNRPFPLILNKSLNLAVLLKKTEDITQYVFATVQIPSVLPRLISVPSDQDEDYGFILLESVIYMHIHMLFKGREVISISPYRITRNADLSIQEEEAEDLLIKVEESLRKRKWGTPIRIEIQQKADRRIIEVLKDTLEVHPEDFYYIKGPIDLSFLWHIYNLKDLDHLKYTKFKPKVPNNVTKHTDIFSAIRETDLLVHHPYESFETVEDFIQQAVADPSVLAVKQTLYRVSGDSNIIHALAAGAEAGKQVTVLVEVTARFDEEQNIGWAKQLEQSGCHVLYGLAGLKTHAKITLVIRKEADGIKRYVHMATGNYNDITAKQYTDIGLFTCDEAIGRDVSEIFNMLSGYSEPPTLEKLSIAPFRLREEFISLIDREARNAESGYPAKIIAKMNSLADTEIIIALYRASMAGVKIQLIVRGICCLKPGVTSISENITVKSIVGRFLEHSRIFYFHNNGNKEVFLSSADWMRRNLDRRVEILVPVENPSIKERIIMMLEVEIKDNTRGRYLCDDGSYVKIRERGKKPLDAQEFFMNVADGNDDYKIKIENK